MMGLSIFSCCMQQPTPSATVTPPPTVTNTNQAAAAAGAGAGTGASTTAPSAPPEAQKYEPSAPPEAHSDNKTTNGKARPVYLKLPLNFGNTITIGITPKNFTDETNPYGDDAQQKAFIEKITPKFKSLLADITTIDALKSKINAQSNLTVISVNKTPQYDPLDAYRTRDLFIDQEMKTESQLSVYSDFHDKQTAVRRPASTYRYQAEAFPRTSALAPR